jgi:hypothetical protein
MESCYSTTNQSVTTPSPLPYEILSFFVIIRLGNITLQDGFYFSVWAFFGKVKGKVVSVLY